MGIFQILLHFSRIKSQDTVARLAHKYKIFRDFKFAAKESNPDGSVTLAEISL